MATVCEKDYSTISIWDKKLVFDDLFKGLHLSKKVSGNFSPDLESISSADTNENNDICNQLPLGDLEVATAKTCSVCNVTFGSRQDQVLHFKLDWHCENLKRRDDGLPPLDKECSADTMDQNQESDNSLSSDTEEDFSEAGTPNAIRLAKIFFENERGEMLSVYKCVILKKKEGPLSEAEIVARFKQLPSITTWAVLLLGGGHFAGAIFKNNEVLVHKTFHRYVTRAKQGSVQSIYDQHGKHAKSAGAQLRRHNELALIEEVQTLCRIWSEQLNGCSHIFYRATGNNKRALFGGKKPLFLKDDLRLCSIPFPTKHAKHQEVVRVCNKLSAIECYGSASEWAGDIPRPAPVPTSPKKAAVGSKLKPGPLKAQNEQTEKENVTVLSKSSEGQYDGRIVKPNKKTRQETPQCSRSSSCESNNENLILGIQEQLFSTSSLREFEVVMNVPDTHSPTRNDASRCEKLSSNFDKEAQRLRNSLYTACKVDDVETIQSLLSPLKHGYNADSQTTNPEVLLQILNSAYGNSGSTLLHVCAQCGYTHLLWILLESGADPAIGDKKGQPAYISSVNQETRKTFRKFMAAFPEKYNYVTAQVPSPLSDEAEKAKLFKQQQKRQQRKQKTKVLKMEQEEKAKFLNSTDVEKKAHAMKAVLRCFFCGESLEKKVPFSYDEFKFCTLRCLQQHRRR